MIFASFGTSLANAERSSRAIARTYRQAVTGSAAPGSLPQRIHRHGQDDTIADRRHHACRDFDRPGVQHAVVRTEPVCDLLAQLDLQCLHPPLLGVHEDRGDLAHGEPVGRDHGPSAKGIVREAHASDLAHRSRRARNWVRRVAHAPGRASLGEPASGGAKAVR
jgi:hypothetical protein